MTAIRVCDVHYDYKNTAGVTHALCGVNAVFESGKTYAITGRSGSGKTTLLSLLALFDKPSAGKILYAGEEISNSDASEFRRKNIGVIFQSYNLIQHLSALENVMLAAQITGADKNQRRRAAEEALKGVGLGEKYFSKRPQQLSGGEQQRVAIARTIATRPKIILADEPTGNLDNQNSAVIISILKKLSQEENRCVIIVTHADEIAEQADIRLDMSDGKISSAEHR